MFQESKSEAESHRLVGGALCLDFANTLNGHKRPAGHEYLKNYRDLLLWCRKAGVLSDDEVAELLEESQHQAELAAHAYRRLIGLREAIFRIFDAIASGKAPPETDLVLLNEARTDALVHSQIVQSEDGFAMDWSDKSALERMAWPLTLSAAELLTSPAVHQVRQCAGEGCDWLFVDTSRNHLRRWCSMDECGNRAKSQRFAKREAQRSAGRKHQEEIYGNLLSRPK